MIALVAAAVVASALLVALAHGLVVALSRRRWYRVRLAERHARVEEDAAWFFRRAEYQLALWVRERRLLAAEAQRGSTVSVDRWSVRVPERQRALAGLPKDAA